MGKIIGIDLGTTNSCVAVMEGNEPVVIPNEEGKRTTPSVVAFLDNGERKIGDPAKRQAITNPTRTISSIKRFMGNRFSEVGTEVGRVPYKATKGDNDTVRIEIDGRKYTPQEISAMVLQKMKKTAEDFLGTEVTEAVVTVPAYFNDSQRQATKEAGEIAGLKISRIVNEPTAAALAYGLDKKGLDQTIAVFDLGGGTFDISILELGDGVFEVKSTNGDTHLGGDDFDYAIAQWLCAEIGMGDSLNPMEQRILLETAKAAKEELTDSDEVQLEVLDWQGTLSREIMDTLIEDLVAKTVRACRRALRDAGVGVGAIDNVVLVGGSTRTPLVRRQVADYFGVEPMCSLDPDCVVAMGAAVQADVLVGNKSGDEMLLLDVIPLSLGIELSLIHI